MKVSDTKNWETQCIHMSVMKILTNVHEKCVYKNSTLEAYVCYINPAKTQMKGKLSLL